MKTIDHLTTSSNIPIYITVNRNGFINCWLDEPTKDSKIGKWVGKYTFANSIVYGNATQIVKETQYSWNNNEPIIITLTKNVSQQ